MHGLYILNLYLNPNPCGAAKIPDEHLRSPHFNTVFFKKCVCVSRHFYVNQKDMMLLSLMYFVIEYLLLERLAVSKL